MTHLLERNQVQNKRDFIKIALECSDGTLNEFTAGGAWFSCKVWEFLKITLLGEELESNICKDVSTRTFYS